MKRADYNRCICFVASIYFSLLSVFSQGLVDTYDRVLPRVTEQSVTRAKGGNSYYFMELSNFINANNQMFQNSGNKDYLDINRQIIGLIINSGYHNMKGKEEGVPIWFARFNYNKTHHDSDLSGQEVPLYESYIMRYIAQYCLLVNKEGMKDEQAIRLVKDTFDKWYYRGIRNNQSLSVLIRSRIHMGAQWASTAMYLYVLTNNVKYLDFVTKYNDLLRENLREYSEEGAVCYIWNSTYDNDVYQLPRITPIIQDVAHGNHVVQYMIDSYKCGVGDWETTDLQKLSNTLKYIIWDSENQMFNDNVDGSNNLGEGVGQGWKQSDGWMKLSEFDPELKKIYTVFYTKNKNKIDSSFLNLQTLSVLSSFKN